MNNMIFAVATNNQKKLKEFQRILDSFGITAKTLRELGIETEIEGNIEVPGKIAI